MAPTARAAHLQGSRRGQAPTWLLLVLALGACAVLARHLRNGAEVRGFHRVDVSRVALETAPGQVGLPAEWSASLAAQLAQLGQLSTLDDGLVERIRAEIAEMPFVLEVGEARVLWPDGVTLDVRLREPVACVLSGIDYLSVARDGTLLPGYWTMPPDFGLGLLPVIGPNDGTFDLAVPGDVLQEERHLDALSVAVSMREHLTRDEIARVGRLLIDASEAPLANVQEPGTRLKLEERRRVLWGRVPRSMAPGELPERQKWNHVMTAIGYLEGTEPTDWAFVDVRWDTATLQPR